MDFTKFSEGYNFVCCVLWQAGVYYVFPRTIPHKIDGDGMTSDIIIASSAFYVSLQISPNTNIIIVYRVGYSQRFDIYTIIIYIIYINAGDSRPGKPLG